jgi:tight adherence protein B
MNAADLRLLLLLSFPLLAGLAGGGLLIANAEHRRRLLAVRFARILPAAPQAANLLPIARDRGESRSAAIRLAAVFGCDPRPAAVYPVRWWIVLAGTCALGRAAAGLMLPLFGAAGWALWPATWVLASRALFRGWEKRRRDTLLLQLPDALATIVRSVRVGIPVAEAIRQVGREAEHPTGSEFRQLVDEISIGVPLDAALRALSLRSGLTEYRFFATTVSLQAQTGGPLGEALEILAEVVRRRIALRARGYALTSEVRASAMVLCAMPFVAGGAMALMTPAYMGVLFTTTLGNQMLGAAGVSLAIGIAVMRALTRKVLA